MKPLKEATDGNVVSFAYLRSDYTPGAVTLVADAGSSELHDPSRATVTLVADAGSSGLHDLPELP